MKREKEIERMRFEDEIGKPTERGECEGERGTMRSSIITGTTSVESSSATEEYRE